MVDKIERLRQTCHVVREAYPLIAALGRPTLGEAVHYLELLTNHTPWVHWNKQWLRVCELPRFIRITRTSTLVPIKFVGGPPTVPGHTQVFKGSLYTLLLDRLLTSVHSSGLAATDLKLGSPCRTSDQLSLTSLTAEASQATHSSSTVGI